MSDTPSREPLLHQVQTLQAHVAALEEHMRHLDGPMACRLELLFEHANDAFIFENADARMYHDKARWRGR